MEEHHDLADDFLLRPRLLDAPPALGANALDIFQPGGFLLDGVKDALSESGYKLPGINGADALDHAAAQVLLDAFPGRWRRAGKHLRPELEAKLPVPHPAPLRSHPFPGTDRWKRTHNRHLLPVPPGFHPEHGETVFLVEEGNSLDQPGKAVGELLGRLRLQSIPIVLPIGLAGKNCHNRPGTLSRCRALEPFVTFPG